MNAFANTPRRSGQHTRRTLVAGLAALCLAVTANAANIVVNSLLDDVYVSASGATFSGVALLTPSSPAYCTLRMAIAAANLDLAVGSAGGCTAGNSSTVPGGITSGIPDTITFAAALAGTINVNVASKMSEAPATLLAGMGSTTPIPGDPTPNVTSALVVSRALEIIGNVDGAGAPSIALDGGLLANAAVDGRLLLVADGSSVTDTPISITHLKFQNARLVASTGGCMFSRKSVRLTNVIFDNCVSEGSANGNGYGGALGVFTSRSWTAALPAVGSIEPMVRPNVTLINVIVRNSRALRGASANNSNAGGMALGSSNATTPGYVGNVYLSNVLVENCQADSIGGFILRGSPVGPLLTTVEIVDSTIRNNTATGTYDGTVGNTVNSGITGGFSIRAVKHAEISRTSITGNLAGQSIGGLELRDSDTLTLTDLTVGSNVVTPNNPLRRASEGGLTINNVKTVRGFRLTVENNLLNTHATATSPGFAGGAYITNGTGTTEIRDSVFRNNVGNNSSIAGLYVLSNANVVLERVKITGNSTTKAGTFNPSAAAIQASRNGVFKLLASEISGNSSAGFSTVNLNASFNDNNFAATPVAVSPLPPLTNTVEVIDSAIHSNVGADATVYLQTPGIYTVRNTTIANNSSANSRAGLNAQGFNPFSGATGFQLRVENSTIARNVGANNCCQALHVGAWTGFADGAFNGTVTVESSILGLEALGSTDGIVHANDPSKVTLIKTLVENGGDSVSAQCGLNGNVCNVNPQLDTLAYNGGLTRTMRLLAGSPAINAGSNPASAAFDQRGATRVQGAAADMGAYETAAGSAVACNLDMDGDSILSPTKEGLVLVRAMLGFIGPAITAGTGLTASWATLRANLNANCGTSFGP